MQEFISMWKKTFDYSGRATRREFWIPIAWFFALAAVEMVLMCGSMIFSVIDETLCLVVFLIICLVCVVVNIAVNVAFLSLTVRRFHDVGLSGWWYLLACVLSACGIGSIIVLVIACLDSADDNQWGPNPKKINQSIYYNQNPYQSYEQSTYQNGGQNPYQSYNENQFQNGGQNPYQNYNENQFQNGGQNPYQSYNENQFQNGGQSPYQSYDENQFQNGGQSPYQSYNENQFQNGGQSPYQSYDENQFQNGRQNPYQNQNDNSNENL